MNRPIGKKSYNSINHLHGSKLGKADKYVNDGQNAIMTTKRQGDIIWATEKYDGANMAIANVDNQIFALTRSGYNAFESEYKHHLDFAKWCDAYKNVLSQVVPKGHRLCVELLTKIHSLEYKPFGVDMVAFDLINNQTNKRLPYLDFLNMDTFAIPKARLIYVGPPCPITKLLPKLNGEHNHIVKCSELPEGIISRVERQGEFMFAAKWVRHDFEPGKFM